MQPVHPYLKGTENETKFLKERSPSSPAPAAASAAPSSNSSSPKARVVAFARNREALQELADAISRWQVLLVVGDVTQGADLQRLVDETRAAHGRVDVPSRTPASHASSASRTAPGSVLKRSSGEPVRRRRDGSPFPALLGEGASVQFITTFLTQVGFPGLAIYSASKAGAQVDHADAGRRAGAARDPRQRHCARPDRYAAVGAPSACRRNNWPVSPPTSRRASCREVRRSCRYRRCLGLPRPDAAKNIHGQESSSTAVIRSACGPFAPGGQADPVRFADRPRDRPKASYDPLRGRPCRRRRASAQRASP